MRGHSWIILYFLNSLRPIFFGLVDCLFSWLSTTDLFFFFCLVGSFPNASHFFLFLLFTGFLSSWWIFFSFVGPISNPSLHFFFLFSLFFYFVYRFLLSTTIFLTVFLSIYDGFFFSLLSTVFSPWPRFLFSLSLFCWLVHHHPIVFMALHPPPAWTRRGCQVLLTWPRSEETNL